MKALVAAAILSLSLTANAQTVTKIGCGEYARFILRADNGMIYEDYWNGHNVSLTQVNTEGKKIIDIAGALYSAVGVDEEGHAWVFGQGSIKPTRIEKDTAGSPFTGNRSCTAYFGTYVTLKSDGSVWLWGKDAWALFSDAGGGNLGKPTKLKSPKGIKFKKIRAANLLLGLATDGSVWTWSANKGVPTKIALPGAASDIAGSHSGFYIAIIDGWPYGWGAESIYIGAAGSLPTPTPLKNLWNLKSPIRRISANHNTVHFIDGEGRLFGLGDNPMGEVGNGSELVNHADQYKTPYAWSWTKHENLVKRPVEIGAGIKWKDVWADNSYAFYHYAIDEHDSLYFWGRSKSWVSGISHSNEDQFPNAFDVLRPTMIHPFITPSHHYGPFSKYICKAGENKTITGDSIHLKGEVKPSTGYEITSLKWTQISGPSTGNFGSPEKASTPVSNLKPGVYKFRLQMIDNNTASISDTITITVRK